MRGHWALHRCTMDPLGSTCMRRCHVVTLSAKNNLHTLVWSTFVRTWITSRNYFAPNLLFKHRFTTSVNMANMRALAQENGVALNLFDFLADLDPSTSADKIIKVALCFQAEVPFFVCNYCLCNAYVALHSRVTT